MNIMFWIIIIILLILLWFLLAFIFKPIGAFFCRIWEDAMNEINPTDVGNRTEEHKNNNEERKM